MASNPTTPVPPPPPIRDIGRWERVSDAAARVGLPSADMLESELSVGRVPIRSARLGARRMLFVSSADIDAWARLAAQGALA